MNITQGCIVSLDYALSIEDGQLVESSENEGPLEYLHGGGEIPPNLEAALEGKAVGAAVELTLEPADAFGDYDLEAITTVPRGEFPEGVELVKDQWVQVGVELEGEDEGEDGEYDIDMRIVEVGPDAVVLDANHPLAGKTITYKVEVREVREATPEDLEAREHVHDENCDH
jgi:FKBP-type peptidyl-prolyl cis-trans isomerase SlyD